MSKSYHSPFSCLQTPSTEIWSEYKLRGALISLAAGFCEHPQYNTGFAVPQEHPEWLCQKSGNESPSLTLIPTTTFT